jgi:hypothetical protein
MYLDIKIVQIYALLNESKKLFFAYIQTGVVRCNFFFFLFGCFGKDLNTSQRGKEVNDEYEGNSNIGTTTNDIC